MYTVEIGLGFLDKKEKTSFKITIDVPSKKHIAEALREKNDEIMREILAFYTKECIEKNVKHNDNGSYEVITRYSYSISENGKNPFLKKDSFYDFENVGFVSDQKIEKKIIPRCQERFKYLITLIEEELQKKTPQEKKFIQERRETVRKSRFGEKDHPPLLSEEELLDETLSYNHLLAIQRVRRDFILGEHADGKNYNTTEERQKVINDPIFSPENCIVELKAQRRTKPVEEVPQSAATLDNIQRIEDLEEENVLLRMANREWQEKYSELDQEKYSELDDDYLDVLANNIQINQQLREANERIKELEARLPQGPTTGAQGAGLRNTSRQFNYLN